MDALSLPPEVHRLLATELIEKAPAAVIDNLLFALCARLRASEHHETGHPSDLERVARLLRAFEASVHLPVIVYDALDGKRSCALLLYALDRFAIDGAEADVAKVAAAAERFLRAVRAPAISSVAVQSTSRS